MQAVFCDAVRQAKGGRQAGIATTQGLTSRWRPAAVSFHFALAALLFFSFLKIYQLFFGVREAGVRWSSLNCAHVTFNLIGSS